VDREALGKVLDARALARKAYRTMDTVDDPAVRARSLDALLADPVAFRVLTAKMPRGLREGAIRAAKAGRTALDSGLSAILWTESILDLEAAREAAPGDGYVEEILARVLQFRGEFLLTYGLTEDAEGDFRRACQVQPGNAVPWFRVAFCLYTRARGDSQSPLLAPCEQALADCLARNPENEEALVLRGVVLALRQQDGPAEAAFRKALEVRPDSTLAMGKYARFLLEHGRGAEAKGWIHRGLRLEPTYPELVALLKTPGME
jgi:tetratricopeptide (TPR) repeat protein